MAAAAAPIASAAALQLLSEFQQVQAERAALYARFAAGFRDFLRHGQERAHAALMAQVTPGFAAASKQVIEIEARLKTAAVGRPDLAALLRRVQELEREKLQLTLSWQALRAAHASGRFSWQPAADRPHLGGGGAGTQPPQEAAAQLVSLLQRARVDQSSSAAPAAAAAGAADGEAADVAPLLASGSGSDQGVGEGGCCVAVKPGFYQQQLASAMEAAAAATAVQCQAGVAATAAEPAAAAGAGHSHCCGGGHSLGEPPDPLEPHGLEPSEAEYGAAVREALLQLDAVVASINEALDEVREAAADLAGEAGGAA